MFIRNKNVDIRFYGLLEKDIHEDRQSSDNEHTIIFGATVYSLKTVLSEQLNLLFGSFHLGLVQAAPNAFQITKSSLSAFDQVSLLNGNNAIY